MDSVTKDNDSETDIVVEEIVDEETSASNENDEPDATETVEEDSETTPQETIEKQRMEKVFKKQEEEWLNKKEKVSRSRKSFLISLFFYQISLQNK